MERQLQKLLDAGQSVWLDDLSRRLPTSGELSHRIDQGIRGVTCNPTIFGTAIEHGNDYDATIADLGAFYRDAESVFWELAIADTESARRAWKKLSEIAGHDEAEIALARVNIRRAAEFHGVALEEFIGHRSH